MVEFLSKMDTNIYLFLSCLPLLHFVAISRACSCRPNLKEEACKSDYVIIAEVLEERQMMSQKGWVFHYGLNVEQVIKTSASYEGSEKVMQIKLRGDGCWGQLKTGHTYIFAGHTGEYVDEGVPRTFLETEYCNYVDFEDLALNVEVFGEIIEMIENPPACIQSSGTELFAKRGRWNNPFQKRTEFSKI